MKSLCVILALSSTAAAGDIEHRILVGPDRFDTLRCTVTGDDFPPQFAGFPSLAGDRVVFYNGFNSIFSCGGVYSVPWDGGVAQDLYTNESFIDATSVRPLPPISQFPSVIHGVNAWPSVGVNEAIALNTSNSAIAVSRSSGQLERVTNPFFVFPGSDVGFRGPGLPVFWNEGLAFSTEFAVRSNGDLLNPMQEEMFSSVSFLATAADPVDHVILLDDETPIDGVVYEDFGSNFPRSFLFSELTSPPSLAVDGDVLYVRARTFDGEHDAILSVRPDGTVTTLIDRSTPISNSDRTLAYFTSIMDASDGVLAFVAATGQSSTDLVVMTYEHGVLSIVADQQQIGDLYGIGVSTIGINQIATSQGRVVFTPLGVLVIYENGELRSLIDGTMQIMDQFGVNRSVLVVRVGRDGFDGDRLITHTITNPDDFQGGRVLLATTVPFAGSCAGDCDRSGFVEFADLMCSLTQFGTGDPASDCDDSGTVDFADLVCALFNFGGCSE